MKKLNANFGKGYAKIKIENIDDLWYLNQIIDEGDLISGKTVRKLKIGGEEDRKQKVVKKQIFLRIKAEKIDFQESVLRILGTIEEGPEDIPRGEHHSFNIEEGKQITILKERWLNYQKLKLEEAFASKLSNILIVVFDREEAYFALMKKYGYQILGNIKGNVAKKRMEESKIGNFYKEIISKIKDYDGRYNFSNIVMSSPAFWKDELLKNLEDQALKKKMIMATCSSIGKSGIDEVLKRDEVRNALSSDRITKEINMVEKLMKEISDSGRVAYGLKETEKAAESGAVKNLLVTASLIKKMREEERFSVLENIMKTADSMQAEVHIISSDHEGGKKLDGLGGVGAILRYRMDF